MISIHASEKEATRYKKQAFCGWRFQSTPPRRRRLRISWCYFKYWHFNPRLREGGDLIDDTEHRYRLISIHASEKEATHFPLLPHDLCLISIHASEKEATKIDEEDEIPELISIHASEKEATFDDIFIDTIIQNFNPRLREGGDIVPPLMETMIPLFQSTPPRRRRPACPQMSLDIKTFQSTPPRRRRLQHIVIPQLSCTYLVSTTFLSAIFSFISQYVILFFLF